MSTGIIDYGAGNLRSLAFALERLGMEAFISADPEVLASADRLIFPGVGAAGYAMEQLRARDLDELILSWQRPLLGICLGMQLLCRYSEEDSTRCLGVFAVDVARFTGGVKIPHTGWNAVSAATSALFSGVADEAYQYYVHSFRAALCEHTAAITDYDGRFSAALQRDNFYGVQFHPEKSGAAGRQILQNFLSL